MSETLSKDTIMSKLQLQLQQPYGQLRIRPIAQASMERDAGEVQVETLLVRTPQSLSQTAQTNPVAHYVATYVIPPQLRTQTIRKSTY